MTWGSLLEASRIAGRVAKSAGLDGNEAARNAITDITGMAGFREAPAVDLGVVTRLHAAEKALSFGDAWNLVVALQIQEPLVTYDKKLRSVYRRKA